jgi:hypothetical protein
MIYEWADTDLEVDLSQGKIEKKEGSQTILEYSILGLFLDIIYTTYLQDHVAIDNE